MSHKNRIIRGLFPLCLAALLLAGCGNGAGPDGGDPDAQQIKTNLGPIATYLDLDGLSEETLRSCYEVLDLENKDGGAKLRVTEVIGDGMSLHVAFTLTYPKDSAGIPSPKDISLVQGSSADQGYVGASPRDLQSKENQDGGYDCLATFLYDREVLSPGEPLTLTVTGGTEEGFSCSVTWTPESLGSIRYIDLTDENGTMVGTALLSSFSLNLSLWDTGGIGPQDLQNSIVLFDADWTPLDVQGAYLTEGGTFFTGQFYAPVELSQVAALQIGPYTTLLPRQ